MDDMGLEEEWLSQILGESTRKAYHRQLRYFMEFMGVKSAEELIKVREKERNFETKVIQFYKWLQETKKLSGNSARASIISLQSLFNYARLPIRIKNKLPRLHMRIETWRVTIEDLQKVFRVGDITIKCWLSLSRVVPARMSDMLRITPQMIKSGETVVLSCKENVIGKCYFSDATRILYEQLEKSGKTLPTTQRGIDKMMQIGCKTAGLPRRVNQHLLRKLWISTAINLGLNEVIIKILSFKSVPQETLTYYLDRENLREPWQRVVDALPLETVMNGRVSDLQRRYDELEGVMRVLARYIKEDMERNRSFKQVPKDMKILQDFLGETTDA
jgi:hypothetical protein